MKTNLNKKQTIVLLAIVIITVLLGGLILATSHSAQEEKDAPQGLRAKGSATDAPTAATAEKNGKPTLNPVANKPVVNDDKIDMTETQIKAAGIAIQTANAARIKSTLTLPGEIRFNADKTAHVVPRFSGVIVQVSADLGQQVKKGQVLAVVASVGLSDLRSELLTAQKRQALAATTYEREKKLWEEKISAEQDYLQAQQAMREAQITVQNVQQKLNAFGATDNGKGALNRYEIRAPFDGMLTEKRIALGDAVKEDANIFTISDLSTVWAEIIVPANDLNLVRVGEKVTVKSTSFDSETVGRISYISALLGDQTRTATAHVLLANPKMTWRPGLFVNVEIIASETDVPVAVSSEAIQTVNNLPTVFVRTASGFIAQPVTLGRADDKITEIVKGLQAGALYVAAGSFVLKADLGKSSAKDTD